MSSSEQAGGASPSATLAPEAPRRDGEPSGDPVLEAMDQARALYAQTLRGTAQLRQAQEELAGADAVRAQAEEEVARARETLAKARRHAEAQKLRADRLASALKNIHRAVFGGNVFELILKACLQITGATRGLYVTAWGDGRFRARAAVDVDDYPRAPLSPYLEAVCRKALENGEPLVCNAESDCPDLPKPEKPGESFRNLLVAPAVLMNNFNGLVLAADKMSGDFDKEDAEIVLSIGDQAAVAVENQQLQREVIQAYFTIVGVLADAVEAKDSYTHGHCELVARLARLTAERLGLPEDECIVAFYGGLLHDVGKIGVSDGILNKPGRLTPEEWELMRAHVRMGRDLLGRVPMLARVAEVVMHHHERWDGKGYPEGLKGERIPLAARIVGAADAYCAMVAKRSYKESMADAAARAELARCRGAHFDARVVDALLAVLDTPGSLDINPDEGEPPAGLSHPADFRLLMQSAAPRSA